MIWTRGREAKGEGSNVRAKYHRDDTDLPASLWFFSYPWERAFARLNVACVENSCARRPLTWFFSDDEIRDDG